MHGTTSYLGVEPNKALNTRPSAEDLLSHLTELFRLAIRIEATASLVNSPGHKIVARDETATVADE
jgi:hypothetical protein